MVSGEKMPSAALCGRLSAVLPFSAANSYLWRLTPPHLPSLSRRKQDSYPKGFCFCELQERLTGYSLWLNNRVRVMPIPLGEKRLISVEEAARYLGVQKSTIYSWAWRRKIPSVKMGRRLLFDREDLDRMIEAGKREER